MKLLSPIASRSEVPIRPVLYVCSKLPIEGFLWVFSSWFHIFELCFISILLLCAKRFRFDWFCSFVQLEYRVFSSCFLHNLTIFGVCFSSCSITGVCVFVISFRLFCPKFNVSRVFPLLLSLFSQIAQSFFLLTLRIYLNISFSV